MQWFHNKCYTLGLKEESDIWYDNNGLNLQFKNGDMCGETLQYSITYQIKCGNEQFRQIMTNSPCNIILVGAHEVGCRQSTDYSLYLKLFGVIIVLFVGFIYFKRSRASREQGYTFV